MPSLVRPAAPDDAETLLRLVDGLNAHVGAERGRLTREALLRDAFGPVPRLEILVAEHAGNVAGYAAWCSAYETEFAEPGLYMIDLYVDPDHRRHGLARRLVTRLCAIARERGCGFVWWTAVPGNAEAAGFYASLGASAEPMIVHALTGAPLGTLADEDG